jgi:hypothetical protein
MEAEGARPASPWDESPWGECGKEFCPPRFFPRGETQSLGPVTVGDAGPVHVPVEPRSVDVSAPVDDRPRDVFSVFGGASPPSVGPLELRVSRVRCRMLHQGGHSWAQSGVRTQECGSHALASSEPSCPPRPAFQTPDRTPPVDRGACPRTDQRPEAPIRREAVARREGLPRTGRREPQPLFSVFSSNRPEKTVGPVLRSR